MDSYRFSTRILIGVLMVVLITTLSPLTALKANAETGTRIWLEFYGGHPCTVTNAAGKTLKYDGASGFSGNLQPTRTNFNTELRSWTVSVEDSSRFTFKTAYKGKVYFNCLIGEMTCNAKAKNASSIMLSKKSDINRVTVKGKNCSYTIGGYMVNSDYGAYITGKTSGTVSLADEKRGPVIRGADEKVKIELNDFKDKSDSIAEGAYYMFGKTSVLKKRGESLTASNAVDLGTQSKKKIDDLYLRVAGGGKNLFMTWTKVKGAKSYAIYRYNYNTKKYKKVATQKGNSTNYYNITDVSKNVKYKYTVRASKAAKGNGKYIGKASYWVSALSKSSIKGNAAKITINKKALTGKKGGTKTLKAKITAASGKKLFTVKTRWYSSNKKIAKVNRTTGKVTFVKTGKCYIWAKAHNGKNSKKIKVAVK